MPTIVELSRGVAYRVRFQAPQGRAGTVRIPCSTLEPTRRGRVLAAAAPLDFVNRKVQRIFRHRADALSGIFREGGRDPGGVPSTALRSAEPDGGRG